MTDKVVELIEAVVRIPWPLYRYLLTTGPNHSVKMYLQVENIELFDSINEDENYIKSYLRTCLKSCPTRE
jgi:hypothetical protein